MEAQTQSESKQESKSDIRADSWVMRCVPDWAAAHVTPYMMLARMDRPIGVWLLALPGLWSIWLAAGGLSLRAAALSVLFMIGAVVMRAAGCVVNDMWDRDLDRQVERTRGRPLAAGDVSMRAAGLFLLVLLVIGLGILVQMNGLTIALGVMSLPLVIAYPLMKRITWWPQAFLGLTFNFGALMGWSAMAGEIGIPALMLYIGGIFWTLGYDTIYAHQDIEDDAMAGIKSTARKFGSHSKQWVAGFYGCAAVMIIGAVAIVHGWAAVIMAVMLCHLGWQIWRWRLDDPASALRIFKSNRDCGVLVLVGVFGVIVISL